MRIGLAALGLGLFVALGARAGEKEWKAAHKEWQKQRDALDADRGRDPTARAELVTKVAHATQELVKADPDRAAEVLAGEGVASATRETGEAALAALAKLEQPKAIKAALEKLDKASSREQVLLIPALAGLKGEPVTKALVELLRAKPVAVKAAAAEALQRRGAEVRPLAETGLKRLLRDDSLVVRYAAAGALETITGQRPEGFPAPQTGADGLPDRVWADRVAALVDVTIAAGEQSYTDPLATPAPVATPTGAHKGGKDEPPAAPPLFSPHGLAVRALAGLGQRLGRDTHATAWRFGADARAWKDAPVRLDARSAADLAAWLEKPARERGRDPLGALERALAGESPPDEVFVFLAGPPEGRGARSGAELEQALKDLLWGKRVVVHAIGFQTPPAQEPQTAQERQAVIDQQTALQTLVNQLAQRGGEARIVTLSRWSPEGQTGGGAAEAPPLDPQADLSKPLLSKDLPHLTQVVSQAVARADGAAGDLLEQVGACPDARVVDLLLPALEGRSRAMAESAARGLQRNGEVKVRAALKKALEAHKSTAGQLALLAAYGPLPGQDVTEGLLDLAGGVGPDVRRHVWRHLAGRPEAELQAAQAHLTRLAKNLEGLTGFYASQAQARASGAPAPPGGGLETAEGHLLPARFVAGGVALLFDAHRDLDGPLAPAASASEEGQGEGEGEGEKPPAGPDKGQGPEKQGDKPDQKKGDKKGDEKKGDKKDDEKKAPHAVTRFEAEVKELVRAIEALAPTSTALYLATTAGDTWRSGPEPVGGPKALPGVTGWVEKAPRGGERNPSRVLEKALADPKLEQVHLIVGGLPLRSPGSKQPEELIDGLREAIRARGVEVHVVLFLGPASSPAARADELAALEAVYRPLAEESGGTLLVREHLDLPGQK